MTLRDLATRLKTLITRRQRDAELMDDIEAHLDLLAADFARRGLTPEEARAAARRAFGGVDQIREAYRDQLGWPFLDALGQDARYAARMLRRDPGFALVAVLSLAVGIGASIAAFSVFNAVLLRPLPVPNPDQLVLVEPQRQGDRFVLFNPIFEELRRRQGSLAGMFAVNDSPFLKVTSAESAAPAYVRGSLVSGNYFSVLGVAPALGRLITESDDEPSDTRECAGVISHEYWLRRFERNPDIVGRTLRLGTADCVIVGVAAASFTGHQSGYSPELWLPLRRLTDRALLASPRMAFFSGVMGRIRDGVRVEQAEAELTALYQQILAAEPSSMTRPGSQPMRPTDFRLRLAPGARGLDALRRDYGRPLAIVLAVVAVVLIIAAVNVANLLLARGAARLPELATRAALGAGRGRLVRQLATEGALLAALGGLLGAGLALVSGPALASLVSLSYRPIVLDPSADRRVLAAAIAATMLAAVLAGILPALRLSRSTMLQPAMTRESRTTAGGRQWLTRSLVAAQLALSLLLVTAASLLLRTMLHFAGVDPGFRPEHVVALEVRDEAPRPSFGAIETAAQKAARAARYRALDERLNEIPGVRAASVSWLGLFSMNDLWLALVDPRQPADRRQGRVDYVSARYFETIGMPILRGRGFTTGDVEGGTRVAVVNETLVRQRFGADEALGRQLAIDYTGEQQRPFTIVGIVRDSKYNSLREDRVEPMMWMPLAQAPFPISSVALRVDPGTGTVVGRQAERVIAATDPHVMIRKVTTLSAQVGQNLARERLLFSLSSGFAALALLLAAVGVYGTLAYGVSRRRREIGVRLALGAQRGAVLRLILRDALMLVAAALVAGVPLALATAAWLRAFLFGVTPRDPATLAAACAVLALSATLAAWIPARRAAAVDPVTALRCE